MRIVDTYGAVWHFLYRLADYAYALAHFLDSHEPSVVAVAVYAYCDVKIVVFVAEVRNVFAKVACNAARAQIGAR